MYKGENKKAKRSSVGGIQESAFLGKFCRLF